MYLFFQLPEEDFSNYLTPLGEWGGRGPAFQYTDERSGEEMCHGWGWGAGPFTERGELVCVLAVTGPQSQGLLGSCKARESWQTPGGGSSEAAEWTGGLGQAACWRGACFLEYPRHGSKATRLLTKAQEVGNTTGGWFLLFSNESLLEKPRLVTQS